MKVLAEKSVQKSSSTTLIQTKGNKQEEPKRLEEPGHSVTFSLTVSPLKTDDKEVYEKRRSQSKFFFRKP